MAMLFEWDEEKAKANLRNHSVSIDEAKTVFADIHSFTIFDPKHSDREDRFIDIGLSAQGRLLVLVYTERGSVVGSSVVVKRRRANKNDMNKTQPNQTFVEEDEEMLAEYDFSGGVRGKHAAAYQQGYRVMIHKTDGTTEIQELALPPEAVLLDPDVRLYFKDAETVNRTLRGIIALLPKDRVEHVAV